MRKILWERFYEDLLWKWGSFDFRIRAPSKWQSDWFICHNPVFNSKIKVQNCLEQNYVMVGSYKSQSKLNWNNSPDPNFCWVPNRSKKNFRCADHETRKLENLVYILQKVYTVCLNLTKTSKYRQAKESGQLWPGLIHIVWLSKWLLLTR